jgi:hypothetical protein
MEKMRNAYILVGEQEGKRPRGRPRRRREDNIRMDVRETGRCGMDAAGSGQETVASSCKHSNELSGSIKAENFLTE